MIKVNLVPAEILAKSKARVVLFQAAFVVSLLAVVLAGISFGHWYGKRSLQITLIEKEARLKQLERIVAQVKELEKVAKVVKGRLDVIQELISGRYFYPIFMSDFARSVPSGVKVNSMGTSPTAPDTIKLTIAAVANANEDIAAWVKALEKHAKFEAVEFGAVSGNGVTYTFALTATYKGTSK